MQMRILWLCALLMVLLVPAHAGGSETAPGEWEGVPRVVAVGDVHGAYDKLVAILIESGLTDAELNWTGGEDHLVLVGDYTDRGTREREVLDLLMRLQEDSQAAGGRVHPLIGNHELMNLIRDLRYVELEGFEQFEAEENRKERKKLRKAWIAKRAPIGTDRSVIRDAFDEKFPPGFLARSRNFQDGVYGEWILKQSVTVRINGVVFVHGGLMPEFAALGIEAINNKLRAGVRAYVQHRTVLEDKGFISLMSNYHANRSTAKALVEGQIETDDDDVLAAAAGMREYATSDFFSSPGPMWHRSYSNASERFERDNLTRSLELLGARAMVVAHTQTGNRRITERFAGRLFRSDVAMAYGGDAQALIFPGDWTPDDVRVLDAEVGAVGETFVEPPPGLAISKEGLTPAAIRSLLESAPAMRDRRSGAPEELGARWLHVREDGVSAFGSFWGTDETATHRRAAQELSAFALDRLLGFDLVPTTLVREQDGVAGTVQHVDPRTIDGISVDEHDLPLWDADDLAKQRARTRVFDELMGNCRREKTEILFLPEESRVLLVNHSRAFARSLLAGCGEDAPETRLNDDLETLLESLSLEGLTEVLGPWLRPEQIDAIVKRRDRLMGIATSEAP